VADKVGGVSMTWLPPPLRQASIVASGMVQDVEQETKRLSALAIIGQPRMTVVLIA